MALTDTEPIEHVEDIQSAEFAKHTHHEFHFGSRDEIVD